MNWNITSLSSWSFWKLPALKLTVCALKNRQTPKKESIVSQRPTFGGRDMSVLGSVRNVMNRNHQLTHLTFKRVLGVNSLVGTIQVAVTRWFQPNWKIWVKMGSSSPNRGENQKYLSCHHLGEMWHVFFQMSGHLLGTSLQGWWVPWVPPKVAAGQWTCFKIRLEMNIDSDFQVLCSIIGGGWQTFGTQVMQDFKYQGWT